MKEERIVMNAYICKIVELENNGEIELVSFISREVDPKLFEQAVGVIRNQLDEKEWQVRHKKLVCRIFDRSSLIFSCSLNAEGRLEGDDGGGWDMLLEDDAAVQEAAQHLSPEYLRVVDRAKKASSKSSRSRVKKAR